MKRSLVIIVSFIILPLCAQERTAPADTALTLLRMPDPGILLEQPVFTLPFTFAVAQPEQNRQLPLYQSFAGTPQTFAWERSAPTDLTAPLKLQLYQTPAEKAFKITLSGAMTAGALYVAYKHVKKYGFK
ncbi:MAG: hypothetical protein HUU02_05655 [Bacteroidetes bacterium]|nr:hypothetical protein [Bacteroidota bacterium]